MNGEHMSKKKKTLDDIARELSVSKTTVSRAISGKGRVSPETRERILAYIRQTNYQPNAIAKSLAQKCTNNICYVIPGDYSVIDIPFFLKCLMGINEMAANHGVDVVICMVTEQDISQLKRIIENRKVDGVILSRTLLKDSAAEYLLAENIPFVTIGISNNKEVIQIDNDHRNACRELTSLLLQRGIRKFALIGGNTEHMVTQMRLQGFRDAFDEIGLKADDKMTFVNVESDLSIHDVVEEALKRNSECIVCMDDVICTRVLSILRKKRIRIPSDIKVASFHSSLLMESNVPKITSLVYDIHKLGMVTCEVLLEHIANRPVPQRTMLDYEIAMKESTD